MSDPETRKRAITRVSAYLHDFLADPQAFRGQQVRGGGPVAEFEALLAARTGFPCCVATSNATTGLLALAVAADWRDTSIIVPARAWEGSLGALKLAGARLLTADCRTDGTVDPASVERLMGKNPVSAILAGDWAGARHDSENIRNIADEAFCLYIEDSSWIPLHSGGRGEFSLADVQVVSFGPGKPISLGEGGAVLLRSTDLSDAVVAVCQHPERVAGGISGSEIRPLCLNARIHPLAAILGVELLS